MANDKQLTASDIKGDLAQRLRCPTCTVPFNQLQGRNRIEIEKQETKDSPRKAVSFICDECKDKGRQPDTALRLIVASDGTQIINEVKVEDLPALGTSTTRSNAPTRSRTASRGTRSTRGGRRQRKTTPTEEPTASGALEAARPQITTVDED
jgi:hypothetical protein